MKIGIIGTGRIAKRFVPEACLVDGVEIACVYNPHESSAKQFVENVWNSASYGTEAIATVSEEELFDTVDAVYIASPHETHFDYIINSLEHNKHVLCEKPMTLNANEAKTAFSIAEDNGLVLMEGLKTAFCPGYKKLLEVAVSGVIGDIRYIDSCFTKLENENTRELTDRKFGGSFTELGSYCMLPVFDLFGSEYTDVRFSSIRNPWGIDTFTRLDLLFRGRMASMTCGLGVKSEGRLLIGGTKGYILVTAPWWKTNHFEVHFEDPSKVVSYDEEFVGDGLRYEIEEFVSRIEAGKQMDSRESGRSICMADMMERFKKPM